MTELTQPGDQAPAQPDTPVEPAATDAHVAPVAPLTVTHLSPSPIRVAIVAAGLVAILGGAAITFAANRDAATPAESGTAASLETGTVLEGEIFAFGGPGFGRHGGFHDIEVTAINGNNISLTTADGWTRTITVDSGTTYERAGETIALGDVKVGDQVRFMQTLDDDGTYTIDAVVVVLPHVGGEVTA